MGGSSSKAPLQDQKCDLLDLKEKQAADDQAKKQATYDLHRYIEDDEDLDALNLSEKPLIKPEGGYRVELGGSNSEAHFNYVGGNASNPVVFSLVQLDKVKNQFSYSVLIRTKKQDYIYNFTAKDRKAAMKNAEMLCPELQPPPPLSLVKSSDLSTELQHMESRLFIKAYRIGVIYAGLATDENTMFSNNNPSSGFSTFMKWLADPIELQGWKGFRGGLDVELNTTGKKSYFTSANGFDLMFHVSTELPFTEHNSQQVERKRHIGNDVVVIVYQDGPTLQPFSATCITSKFNHVYLVIQAVPDTASTSTSSQSASTSTDQSSSAPITSSTLSTSGAAPSSSKKPRRTSKATSASNNVDSVVTSSNPQNSHHPASTKKKPRPSTSSANDRNAEIEEAGQSSHASPSSHSNHGSSSNKLRYKLAVVSKDGVHSHGPVLPQAPHLWELDDSFRTFLITKIMNAERAAYYAPGFAQTRTRRLWLKELLEKYGPPPKPGSSSPASADG